VLTAPASDSDAGAGAPAARLQKALSARDHVQNLNAG
jgi:hypothetical protein